VAFSGYKIQRKKAERGERAYGKKRTQGEEKNRGGGETKKREKKSEGASIQPAAHNSFTTIIFVLSRG
jgi:hypothetical protein